MLLIDPSKTPPIQKESVAGFFPDTRWSVVQRFQQERDESKAWDSASIAGAANELCHSYWRPVFLHVRAKGLETEDAKDVTQQIFSSLFETQRLKEVDESKGRLRSFLRAVANRHVAEFIRNAGRIKRGGDQVRVEIDPEELEAAGGAELPGGDMDRNFDRQWAEELMDRVEELLRESYRSRDRGNWFETLFPMLTSAEEAQSYSALAQSLAVTESAIRVGIHRMRKRYRDLLRKEIAQTVDTEDAIDEELRALYAALQAG